MMSVSYFETVFELGTEERLLLFLLSSHRAYLYESVDSRPRSGLQVHVTSECLEDGKWVG